MHQVSDIWSGGGASLLLMSFLFYLFLECRILDDGFVNSKTMIFFGRNSKTMLCDSYRLGVKKKPAWSNSTFQPVITYKNVKIKCRF